MAQTVFKTRVSQYRAHLEKELGMKILFCGERFNEVYPFEDDEETPYIEIKICYKDLCNYIKENNL